MRYRSPYITSLLTILLLTGCSTDEGLPGGGTWRVINYWAIWCTPCREEVPELNRLATHDDITLMGVNFDAKQGADLAEDIEALKIRFPTINDPSSELGITRPDKLPTTVIVTPQGEVARVLVGPQTEDAILASLKKAKVAGQKNADPSVGE